MSSSGAYRRRREASLRGLVQRAAPGARIYFPRGGPPGVGYSWNGRHLRPTGLTLESQIHEIAHLLLASKERLALPEFGLGPDPYRRNEPPCVLTAAEADREELDACDMQMLLVRLLGLSEVAVQIEYATQPTTAETVRRLRTRYPDALPESWWARARASVEP